MADKMPSGVSAAEFLSDLFTTGYAMAEFILSDPERSQAMYEWLVNETAESRATRAANGGDDSVVTLEMLREDLIKSREVFNQMAHHADPRPTEIRVWFLN